MSDDGDLRLLAQPGLGRGRLAVWKQADGPPTLQITDDRPVAMVASPGPVIDANHVGRRWRCRASSADYPQQRVVADRQHQALGKARSWSAAEGRAQVMHQALQPSCSSRPWRQHRRIEPLGEDTPVAKHRFTPKSPNLRPQRHGFSGYWKVEEAADVAAVNAVTHGAAAGTSTCRARAPGVEGGEPIGGPSADDSKAGWDETGLRKAFGHSADPSVNLTPVSRPTSSKLSQSQF